MGERKAKVLFSIEFFSIVGRYYENTNYFSTHLHLKKNQNKYNYVYYIKNSKELKRKESIRGKSLSGRVTQKRYRNSHKKESKCRQSIARLIHKYGMQRDICAICGKENSEFHHFDYNLPHCGIWFCKKHHSSMCRGGK